MTEPSPAESLQSAVSGTTVQGQPDPKLGLFSSVRQRILRQLVGHRTRRGISQEAIAERMGTAQPAIARLEAGLSDPRLSTIERYAAALDADVEFTLIPRGVRRDYKMSDIETEGFAVQVTSYEPAGPQSAYGVKQELPAWVAIERAGGNVVGPGDMKLDLAIKEIVQTLSKMWGIHRVIIEAETPTDPGSAVGSHREILR